MFFSFDHAKIYFYGAPVDLRKGCEGLAFISSSIETNPTNNTYFLFLNRKRNRMKILYWSKNDFFYLFVRSRKGVFAPKNTMTSEVSFEEMQMILNYNFPKRLNRVLVNF